MFGGRGITVGGMGKIIENVGPSLFLSHGPELLPHRHSSTERHHSTPFSLVRKTYWAIWACGRRFARYQRTHVCKRWYARLCTNYPL